MNLNNLFEQFFALYGNPDEKPRVFFAPGRVNLIGEHTDYNGGFVLPCALQYGTYLLIRPSGKEVIKFASTNFEFRCEIGLNDISAKVNDQWVNYPLGIMDQLRQMNVSLRGFEMLYSGDIPNNAGLSSSASIEMVTAYALATVLRMTELSMMDLVKLSQRAENQFVGVNCGIMDQFAVGMGVKDHALFLNCQTLEYKTIPIRLDGFTLIIANTNKKRGLAGSKYNERVTECQLAVTYLNPIIPLSKLGDISFMQFYKIQDQIPDELVRKRARHVISENQRVLNAVSCLHKGDLAGFGALMNASHESLRDNYEVTGFELDTLVEEAQKVNGVIGARMTGAGFGGCTVNLVRNNVVEGFMERVGTGYECKTGIKPTFYHAEISNGTREILINN
ncbi:MAG: galactokinase [Bacteroidales bacterium]|nr:galactokinase [Bacteroidales bacterium]